MWGRGLGLRLGSELASYEILSLWFRVCFLWFGVRDKSEWILWFWVAMGYGVVQVKFI